MSDLKPTAFDPDDIYWGFDSAAPDTELATITQPGASKRQTGWTAMEKPPRAYFNWFMSRLSRIVFWIMSNQVRRFADIDFAAPFADAHMALGDRFDVYPDGGNLREPLASKVRLSAYGATRNPVTDGPSVYWLDNSGGYYVRSSSVDDLSSNWSKNLDPTTAPQALCCDGSAVYVGYGAAGAYELWALDPTDGATLYQQTMAVSVGFLSSNGEYLMVGGTTATGTVYRYLPDLTSSGNNTHGGTIQDMALNHDRVFVVGTWNGSSRDVSAFDTSDMGNSWAITLGAADPAAATAKLACDGQYLYVAGITDAGGNTLHKLSCYDGSVVWSVAVGTATPEGLCVDDRYLYLGDGYLMQVDKVSGALIGKQEVLTIGGRCSTNGVHVFCEELGTPGLMVLWCGGPAKTFQMVDGSDKHRRPFYQLAIPA